MSTDEARAQRITAALEHWKADLLQLSHEIHADPELSGQEFRAAQRVSNLLEKAGFGFDAQQPQLATAFSARHGNGELVAAFCVEYDALPGIGHACGHNVNAAAAVGAALGLAAVAGELGITVKVLGTPAEETTGGKVELIKEGFFDDVSLAMMAHAGADDIVGGSSLAICMWDALYTGKPAHAALAPEEGINALDAMVIAQTAIALARQQLPAGSVVSMIVTEGGSAANVIPDRARANIEMRAESVETLRRIEARVRRCLEAGAHGTGAALDIREVGNEYADLRQDRFLAGAYQRALGARERDVLYDERALASTDMGNVSHLVPTIHPVIGYEVGGAVHHTAEFTAFGTSASADKAIMDAAFGMAMAAAAAAADPVERERLLAAKD